MSGSESSSIRRRVANRLRTAPALAAAFAAAAASAFEPLPEGGPELLAQYYHSALEVPGIADLSPPDGLRLLDVVTHRYKNRLANRGAGVDERMLPHAQRLARSDAAADFPHLVPQVCAQYGLTEGACAPHRGYVRRVLLLEEMLASGRLSLEDVEIQLAGAARAGWRRGGETQPARPPGR